MNYTKTGSLKYNSNYYYSGWRAPSMPTILKADYETCRTSSQNKGKISWRIKADGIKGVTWKEIKVRVTFRVGTSLTFKPSNFDDDEWRDLKKKRTKHSSIQLKVGYKSYGWLTPKAVGSFSSDLEKSLAYTITSQHLKNFGKDGMIITLEAKVNSSKCPKDKSEMKHSVIKKLYKGWGKIEIISVKYEDKKGSTSAQSSSQNNTSSSSSSSTSSNTSLNSQLGAAVYPHGHPKWKKKAWIFSGSHYAPYLIKEDKPTKVKKISLWRGVPNNLDAAVYLERNKHIYFFKGTKYYKFSLSKDKVVGSARTIGKDGWKGVDVLGGVDAAVRLDSNRIYFFKGNKYVRFNIKKDKVDSNVRTINKDGWKGLNFSKIDAAVRWPNGKIYFFSGKHYLRFDIKKDKVDSSRRSTKKGFKL